MCVYIRGAVLAPRRVRAGGAAGGRLVAVPAGRLALVHGGHGVKHVPSLPLAHVRRCFNRCCISGEIPAPLRAAPALHACAEGAGCGNIIISAGAPDAETGSERGSCPRDHARPRQCLAEYRDGGVGHLRRASRLKHA